MNISCFVGHVQTQEQSEDPTRRLHLLTKLDWTADGTNPLWTITVHGEEWDQDSPHAAFARPYVQLELIYHGNLIQKAPQREQLSSRGIRENYRGLTTAMEARVDLLAIAILEGEITRTINGATRRLHSLSTEFLTRRDFSPAQYRTAIEALTHGLSIHMDGLNV